MKAKEYVEQYKKDLENPPKVYAEVPEGTVVPPREAALVRMLQNMLKEGQALLKTRCGNNPTPSASNAILKELNNKFHRIHALIGDPEIARHAFEVYLGVTEPAVFATYLKYLGRA